MRSAVDSLIKLRLRRYRVPERGLARYSALDVVKQALELLFEFSPSEKNYREALRTIRVYSERDIEMQDVLLSSFATIANAVYTAYSGLRYAESLAPEIAFLQGAPINLQELEQSFHFVGVKPPQVFPPSARKKVFLDEHFEPYRGILKGSPITRHLETTRMRHWSDIIQTTLSSDQGIAMITGDERYLSDPPDLVGRLIGKLTSESSVKLAAFLRERGIRMEVVHRVPDINRALTKG